MLEYRFAQVRDFLKRVKVSVLATLLSLCWQTSTDDAWARKHSTASATSHHASTAHATTVSSHHSHSTASVGRHGHHVVTEYAGSHKRTTVVASSHHWRHHEAAEHVAAKPKTRYAYPMGIFMLKPPDFERAPFNSEVASQIQRSFNSGYADSNPARSLVRAGLVSYHPLHGGIFWRREPVKYIIMHSTETGVPQVAPRVIDSWGSMGRRHAGAQYVVDRDGTIYQAVDPDLATVHINIFKTLPGINNDNSIGIEMCHCGHQDYPYEQRQAVIKLVTYLQDRYKVDDDNIITHRYAQQGDHTDPVYFDFEGFLAEKCRFRNKAIAYRVSKINNEPLNIPDAVDTGATAASATTLLQPHTSIAVPAVKVTTQTTTTVTRTTPVVPPAPVQVVTPIESAGPPQAKVNSVETDSGATTTYTWSSKSGSNKMPATLRGPIEVVPEDLRNLNKPTLNDKTNNVPAPEPGQVPGSGSDEMKFIVH
jgi:hypothetical protein